MHTPDLPRRLIAVAIGAATTEDARAALFRAAAVADIAELRLDYITDLDLPRLLRDRPCPVIVTNRAEREGGRFRGAETDRVGPLLEAIDLGAEYVDIEHDAAHLLPDRRQTRLIVSRHDFQRMPADLRSLHRQLAEKGADIVKVVGTARRIQENLAVLDTLAMATIPTVAIAMGEAGLVSRVLALRHDSCFLTYATLGEGERVAPGQLTVAAMHETYQAHRIGRDTAVYGSLAPSDVPTI
jgi:3-dehydroquinate dehydratase / shikimate dehydrogenase